MTNILVPSDTPCVISDFSPDEDMLVIALPDAARSGPRGLDHTLSIQFDPRRIATEVILSLVSPRCRFVIRLPGVRHLDPSAIAVLSLEDAERLTIAPRMHDTATLTGHGLYPPDTDNGIDSDKGPRKMAFTYAHDWVAEGPPTERFFDLTHPESELTLRISDTTGGAVYAVNFTEEAGNGETVDTHRSILICQTAPGTERLSPAALTQWFATRLGGADFRVIAWIYLGNAGSFRDPESGKLHRFGGINEAPRLALQGPIAGSVAIRR